MNGSDVIKVFGGGIFVLPTSNLDHINASLLGFCSFCQLIGGGYES